MFEKMLEWIRQKLSQLLGKADETTVSDILVSDAMESGVALWSEMYRDKAPWIGPGISSLGLAAAISEEFARLVTLEMVSELTGSARATFLDTEYQDVIRKIKASLCEYACAKGGLIFKPYVSDGAIRVDCVQADRFYPIAFDASGELTGAVFTEQITRRGYIYTRLEAHRFEGGRETVRNRAYASKYNGALGAEVALTDVPEWATLEPETSIDNLEHPLFAYFRPAVANNIDDASPLGVSVFSRATELIRDADKQYGRLLWEFDGGELAVDAAYDVVRANPDGTSSLPKGKDRLFRHLGTANSDFYSVFSPALRDVSLINGFNAILRRIEFNCRLSYGTLSDVQNVDKTAEEIKASRQRSYSAVAKTQEALADALRRLVYAMDALATLYQLAPVGSIDQSFTFDDSIVADRKTEFAERLQLQTACSLKPEILVAWYFGVSEEQAAGMIASDSAFDFGSAPGLADEGATAEVQGKALNGAQTQSLIAIMAQLAAGEITEGQAINLIATAVGMDKQAAIKLVRGELDDDA